MTSPDKPLAMKELEEVFEDLVTLLKHPDVGTVLTERGVNTSLAIVAAEGLAAYVEGDKRRAAEDFETVAEEIATRLSRAEAERDGATAGGHVDGDGATNPSKKGAS